MSRYRAFCERRIAAGRCVRCNGKLPRDRKAWRCVDCVVANRPAGMRSYHKAKAEGRCPVCRKAWTSDGHVCCPPCRVAAKVRFALRDATTARARRGSYESKKLRRLDALTERCACGLLLPCDCGRGVTKGEGW